MEQFTQGLLQEETASVRTVRGATVISPRGLVLGTIADVRVSPKTLTFEGILVRRAWYGRTYYVGRDYIDKVSPDSVVLSVEPVLFLVGKKAVTTEGEVVGTVKSVVRQGNTNTLKQLIVRKLFRRSKQIPSAMIKNVGIEAIILKKEYHA